MPRITRYCLLALSACLWASGVAGVVDTDRLLSHYEHLHRNPELSLQEQDTSAYLAEQLRASGYEVTTAVGGHGLVAMLRNGAGPTILFRADMDALPIAEQTGLPYSSTVKAVNGAGKEVPVMHACGHDIHMTVLLGIARQMMTDRTGWQGTLLLIAQPAEEIGAGARAMLADGLYDRFPVPDFNLAYHVSPDLPAGRIGYTSGYAMANVDSVDITVYGAGGHGAYPQKTRDPIVMAAQIILALQTIVSRELSPLDSAVVSVGSIHGGTKHNIIPDEVGLQLTVRSYTDRTRDFLLRRIREISRGVARTAGMPADKLPRVTVKDEYTPAVYNNPGLVSRLVPVLKSFLGKTSVSEVDPVMAGEDFARYGRTQARIPGALFWLGAVDAGRYRAARNSGETLPGLHSARFAPAARPTIETGVQAMTAMLLELFRNERVDEKEG
ncbi:MAG: amidohydrolase [Gammaproteobacteria bacterium]|jgi:hippurate hydrolase